VNSFSAQWLQLREPLDAASRAEDLCKSLLEGPALKRRQDSRLAIIDLGAGTGANLRYAAPRLGGKQDWLLVERDPLLLGAMESRMREWAPQLTGTGPLLTICAPQFECRIRHVALDLASHLAQLPLPDGVLLTASALLDLVSEAWLRELARSAANAAATIWFALTYDGRIECLPVEPEDAQIRELVNLHQLNDKGFGPALGPGAAQMVEQIFVEQGYRIQCATSDWCIGPQSQALQQALVEGWFDAACEIAPHQAQALSGWLARRRAHIKDARSELRIGHVDIIGGPQDLQTR
jgi:hypothetical protein